MNVRALATIYVDRSGVPCDVRSDCVLCAGTAARKAGECTENRSDHLTRGSSGARAETIRCLARVARDTAREKAGSSEEPQHHSRGTGHRSRPLCGPFSGPQKETGEVRARWAPQGEGDEVNRAVDFVFSLSTFWRQKVEPRLPSPEGSDPMAGRKKRELVISLRRIWDEVSLQS